jgi:hypothetical protein
MSVNSRRVWLVVILSLSAGAFVAQGIAAEQQPPRKIEPFYSITYPAFDLPVFRPGNPSENFDPSLLIALMKDAIDPPSWTTGDGAVTVFPENLSLVITQTEANHAKIARLLNSARKSSRK